MKPIKILLLIVGLPLLGAFLTPSSGARANPYRQINVKPVYQHHEIAAIQNSRRIVSIASVAQINPAYTSAYSPDGYDSASQADILAELRRVNLRLDAADRAAKAAVGAGVIPPGVKPSPMPGADEPARPIGKGGASSGGAVGVAVLNAKCAACHQASKLTTDQRFTLLDAKGNPVPLTDKQKMRVLTRTYSASMPPPMNIHNISSLTDVEFAALVDLYQ